jgi:hypothetical protein
MIIVPIIYYRRCDTSSARFFISAPFNIYPAAFRCKNDRVLSPVAGLTGHREVRDRRAHIGSPVTCTRQQKDTRSQRAKSIISEPVEGFIY